MRRDFKVFPLPAVGSNVDHRKPNFTGLRRAGEGMSTFEIYEIAFSELKSHKRGSAGKYSLKKAIFQMGPRGFPFEKLIGALFETEGFTSSTGQIVKGRCVSHEVDVVAEKGDLH